MKTIKIILASFLLALATVPAVSGQDSPSLPYDQKMDVVYGGGHPWMTLPEEVKIMADWFEQHLAETKSGQSGAPPQTK